MAARACPLATADQAAPRRIPSIVVPGRAITEEIPRTCWKSERFMNKAVLSLTFVVATFTIPAIPAVGREIVVDGGGDGEFTEIQPAIDLAVEGDTVLVRPGEYLITEPISFKGKLITVEGASGAGETTIRMSERPADPTRATVVVFENREGRGAVLSGFSLTGGGGTGDVVELSDGRIVGASRDGGGVYCRAGARPTLRDCTISGNAAGLVGVGGGVFCESSASPVLDGCTLSGNFARLGGGLCLYPDSTATLTDCVISGNRGGGLYCLDASPTLTRCTISGNVSHGNGGGLLLEGDASPVLIGCTLAENAASDGGALYCALTGGLGPFLMGSTVSGNSAMRGGGLYWAGEFEPSQSTLLNGCILWDNVGGSIFLEACGDPLRACDELDLTIGYSCIEGMEVWPGEGNINSNPLFCGWGDSSDVYVDGASPGPGDGSREDPFPDLGSAGRYSLALSEDSPCLGANPDGTNLGADHGLCDEEGRSARVLHLAPGTYAARSLAHQISLLGAGRDRTTLEGTVYGLRSGAVLSELTVRNGLTGGIVIGAGEAPEVRRCTIIENRGAIDCGFGSSPTLTDCTISANAGTGVRCDDASPELTNCLITGNGAGVRCSGRLASPTFRHCTISGNRGNVGRSGVWCENGSSPTFIGCIVWNNPLGSFAFSDDSTPHVSYSSVETKKTLDGEGNLINVDPRFVREGDFAFNTGGRPTEIVDPGDYRLQSDSPCIDAGTRSGAPTTDLDGSGRPCGGGVDIGAFESGGCPPPLSFNRGDVNADGARNLTDAVFILEHLFGGGREPPCAKSADVNDTGAVDLTDPVFLLGALFSAGPAPPPPSAECGPDPTTDALGCESFDACP